MHVSTTMCVCILPFVSALEALQKSYQLELEKQVKGVSSSSSSSLSGAAVISCDGVSHLASTGHRKHK